MTSLGPLRFAPLLKRAIWGGRRLETLLGKQLGSGNDFAESWEVVDHGADQSVVQFGAFAGRTLQELVRTHAYELLGSGSLSDGTSAVSSKAAHFPLLAKFLDAHQALSVQVHPDDARGALLVPPDHGKTEAWVIVHAEPGSMLYAGLKRGFDRHALEREVARGTTELCLHRVEPQVGDCFFIPAGTVHALGAGLVVAEIQQSSDTTFRLFDWNRVGADGKPRALHIAAALDAIDYERGPARPQVPVPLTGHPAERLVECPYFIIDRWRTAAPVTVGGDGRCHLLMVLQGQITLAQDPAERPLTIGQTVLVPADSPPLDVTPDGVSIWLDATK